MATSKDILNSFGKEATIVKAVALYLGADVRENQEGQFTHQLALLPSERDPKGGVVSIKHSKSWSLRKMLSIILRQRLLVHDLIITLVFLYIGCVILKN